MMIGVTRGFLYKMKLVFNHFPISVTQEDQILEVRNFLGEARPLRPNPKDRLLRQAKGQQGRDSLCW
jgi:ribosomal protein L6P/L9E